MIKQHESVIHIVTRAVVTLLLTAGLSFPVMAGPVDSQRENLSRRTPEPGDSIALQVTDNHISSNIIIECTVDQDILRAFDGAGMMIRISDHLRPVVEFEPIAVRRVSMDLIDNADQALLERAAAAPEQLPENAVFPQNDIVIGEPMIMRSIRVLPIRVNPVRADLSAREFVITEKARIHIRMEGEDTRNVLVNPPPVTRTFDAYYKSTVLNYESASGTRNRNPETYLVFTPDAYESRLQGWIAWKETEGFRVELLRKSELPASPSATDLRNALLAKYNGPNPPVFVLLIGDEYAAPVKLTTDHTPYGGDYADDLFYSALAGDDLLPEFFLGRLPAINAWEVTVMINKIMEYELNPYMGDPMFWQRSLMAASGMYPSQVDTKEQTRERLETYCGHTDVLTYYYDWDPAMIQAMMADISQGVCIINYRGEGWRKGWNPQHEYWFEFTDVYMLQNAHRTHYISSIGCGVSLFNTNDDCWSHAMMAHGMPSVPMGAAAVLGPTWNTWTTYNNWLDRGLYRGHCLWNVIRSGPMMDYGKAYVIEYFPEPEHDIYVDLHCRTYLLFGTPDMWVRSSMPRYVVAGLAYANNGMSRYLAVRDTGGSFVPDAQISWTANERRHVDVTDEYGGVLISETSIPDDHLRFVVTGKNLVPFQGDVPWIPPGTWGDVIITEVKPDIATTGETGDLVELYNAGTGPVDLNGWILSDLDGYDTPFVHSTAVLQPEQLAVIEFLGPAAMQEQIIPQAYGLLIKSLEVPDFSSLEDVVVLRNPDGCVVDSMAYHDNTGMASTNLAWDMSYISGPNSPFVMLDGGWWDAPDVVTPEEYELYAVDWSPFAGMGGDGSIQRATVSFPDGTGDWTISTETNFGFYTHQVRQKATGQMLSE